MLLVALFLLRATLLLFLNRFCLFYIMGKELRGILFPVQVICDHMYAYNGIQVRIHMGLRFTKTLALYHICKHLAKPTHQLFCIGIMHFLEFFLVFGCVFIFMYKVFHTCGEESFLLREPIFVVGEFLVQGKPFLLLGLRILQILLADMVYNGAHVPIMLCAVSLVGFQMLAKVLFHRSACIIRL
ncbi:pE184L [African swine fever virus]|uniref:PE184L n=1 Tax=African swine fever virus TaxID=10497 RepID=A0A894KU57_ASF|nr:pE184L [African swine fever virus]